MIVRRIREHAAELNWFAAAVDLIVAVVGEAGGKPALLGRALPAVAADAGS